MAEDGSMPIERSIPIKLVLLLQDLSFGGTQRYAIHLVKHLNRALFSPEVWVMRGDMDMAPLVREAGVKIVWLYRSSRIGPGAVFSLFIKLMRSPPQALFTLTVVPNIWGRLFGSLAGVPVIISEFRNRIAKQHERWLWPLSAAIVVNAQSLKDMVNRQFSVDPRRIVVIHNGVDTNYFSPDYSLRNGIPTAIFVGRLVEQKDPLNLLGAFRLTLERIPSARLMIVGDGYLKTVLRNFIRSHSLDNNVSLLPGVRDIRPLFREAWVFVLPSLYEGSPNVILEAMAAGLPVIATRVDGVPELVQQGKTGIMVEPRNSPALADAITDILTDEHKARLMGLRSREMALMDQYSVDRMVRQTEKVFLEEIEDFFVKNDMTGREKGPLQNPFKIALAGIRKLFLTRPR